MPIQYSPLGEFLVANLSQGPAGFMSGTPYKGPVPGIDTQLDLTNGNAYHVDSLTLNYFIRTGPGDDIIDAGFWSDQEAAGMTFQAYGSTSYQTHRDIIDGGGGSNFLIGGGGQDTFYVDGRDLGHNVWSTVADFSYLDQATVWGVNQQDFVLSWLDGQGAVGHTGLTAVFSAPGHPAVGLTLSAYTTADLSNGNLTVSFCRTQDLPGLPGSDYMSITRSPPPPQNGWSVSQ